MIAAMPQTPLPDRAPAPSDRPAAGGAAEARRAACDAAAWIDTHCHLDAAEFDADRDTVVERARAAGVGQIVLPAVDVGNFDRVRELAHRHGLSYALGIHPMCTDRAAEGDLAVLRAALERHRDDPRLAAVGEIGLDHFVAGLDRERQARFFAAQLVLAAEFELPVLLHVRRAIDTVLKQLRRVPGRGGIAHAFNGSEQQAEAFVALGFRLGVGGAVTYDRALRIRRVARAVSIDAIVMETDAPDIAPQWLYRTAGARAGGESMRNEPAELARIGAELAALRGASPAELAAATSANALRSLPRLAALMALPA
jgi:TatD DNase family protein